MRSFFPRCNRLRAGFTLLEALAALTVLLMVLGALGQFTASVSQSWQSASANPFGEAASAFTEVTQNLGQATLEPYQDYADASGAFRPGTASSFTSDHLARRSDLAFVCGPGGTLLASSGRTTAAQGVFFVQPAGQTQLYAQTGLGHLFNACGYFVEFGGDTSTPGFFTGSPRLRWRLKQVAQPSEALQVFSSNTSAAWIAQLAGPAAEPSILAENVVALVVLPERAVADTGAALAPAFAYDSRDAGNALTFAQLPPRIRVLLVAIDETSAERLAAASGTKAPALVPPALFQDATQVDQDLATLTAALSLAGIRHRTFQRDLELAASAWSDTP